MIYIDAKRAIQEGVDFYRSQNNVLLTQGKDGKLSKEYITKIVNTKSGLEIPFKKEIRDRKQWILENEVSFLAEINDNEDEE